LTSFVTSAAGTGLLGGIEILGTAERDGIGVARYAWLRDYGKQASEMRLPHTKG
jgi:hypothetical protein